MSEKLDELVASTAGSYMVNVERNRLIDIKAGALKEGF